MCVEICHLNLIFKLIQPQYHNFKQSNQFNNETGNNRKNY
jgi:hypothetical protein